MADNPKVRHERTMLGRIIDRVDNALNAVSAALSFSRASVIETHDRQLGQPDSFDNGVKPINDLDLSSKHNSTVDPERARPELPVADQDALALEDKAFEAEFAAMQEAVRTQVETLGIDEEGRLHRDPREGPAQITVTRQDWDYGGGRTDRTELYVVHGELVARAEIQNARDEEGWNYSERWYDPAGNLHSFNGNPSQVIENDHYIPSETYLDESTRSFHEHGKPIESIDTTYADIVSSKPLSVRQAFGYDVDGATRDPEASRVENYAGRFDQQATVQTMLQAARSLTEREDTGKPRPSRTEEMER
jgi:hypothetical protein